eukprot:64636-Chlamydomonas_euryale.AAC.3
MCRIHFVDAALQAAPLEVTGCRRPATRPERQAGARRMCNKARGTWDTRQAPQTGTRGSAGKHRPTFSAGEAAAGVV